MLAHEPALEPGPIEQHAPVLELVLVLVPALGPVPVLVLVLGLAEQHALVQENNVGPSYC